ncbi:MAG: GDYXXLXY domain-containing protein [Proteobacteria bacterium]|nr:GDYXXLXY domain-containing protein [Pseudomonadota bacterium]
MIALRILIVLVLQTAVLGGMIFERQAMLNGSRVVTLKVVPIDPRDMFRGDYVTLHYAISLLELGKLQGDRDVKEGDTVFVTISQKNGMWSPVALGRERAVVVPGGIALRGKIVPSWQSGFVRVDYGIESYFVPQGTGHEIEQESQKGDLSADIAVDAKGRSAIKAMRGKAGVFYVEGLF